MNRRNLLAGLALAGVDAKAQDAAPGGAEETIYIPKAQRMDDRRLLHDFMDEFAFVELVTVAPALRITHVPVWIEREAGPFGTVHGHVSRQNPQAAAFDGKQTGVVVFRGPDGYISPTWYTGGGNAVPTWNFAVVHATGKLRRVEGAELEALLGRLVSKFESYEGTSYDFAKLDEAYRRSMLNGIVGFSLGIELLEGKFKLGQERSAADRESLLKHLADARQPRGLRELAAGFYERQSKG